jgi:hypothetical protein
MAKRAPAKTTEAPAPGTPPSGTTTTTYRTRKDGTVMKKRCFWIEEEVVHAFEVWCVVNRREPNEVVTDMFKNLVANAKSR